MIIGLGTDIIEVERIRSSHTKFGERFAARILREGEINYCLSHKDPAPFLAVRFAAKEAISKAFGTGIGKDLGWQDMEIARKSSGEPYVILHDKGIELFKLRGASKLHITLSHTTQHATAVAILET
ncbi:MAG: holo-ACP synthase [Verrucomicrobiales bacterium]